MNVPRGLCFCAAMATTSELHTCTWCHDLPSAAPTNSSQSRPSQPTTRQPSTSTYNMPLPPVHQTSLRAAAHHPPDSRASLTLILPRLSAPMGWGQHAHCPCKCSRYSCMASNDSGMSQCNNTNFRQKHVFKSSSSTPPAKLAKTPTASP